MKATLHAEPNLSFVQRLTPDARRFFRTITNRTRYEAGAGLFRAAEPARGVFLIRVGKVKIAASSGKSRTLALRIAWPGELLGVSATVTANPYEMTAVAVEASEVDFASRADFLNFLNRYPAACFEVVQMLSREICSIEDQVDFFRVARLASGRLAGLLLAWCDDRGVETEQGIQLTIPLTEREIGQMIGATRETTARLLGKLKDQGIARRVGQNLLIQDKPALERITRLQTKRVAIA
jgi:CRP/FNR family transcriptional regulator